MNSNGSWVLQVDPAVYKFLEKIPRKDAERIVLLIEKELPLDPFRGDIQKMGGEDTVWRRRVGSYRIRYELIKEKKIIYVFRVERRTSSNYRR